jgi:hypothetical protein
LYAAIRQGKANARMAKVHAHSQAEVGSLPIISDVPGFRGCYVTHAPDHMATAISTFNDFANAEE